LAGDPQPRPVRGRLPAMKRATTYLALLRGINVGGHNKLPMSELRSLASSIGWKDAQTHIQSGNVIFTTSASATVAESQLEQAVARHFSLQIVVVVRSVADWSLYLKGNPFLKEVRTEPDRVMLALARKSPSALAPAALRERAANGERVVQFRDALWFHFPGGVGRTKLSPAVLDRLVGSPVTMRNWRTVKKLDELATAVADNLRDA
jgi:uncharacterized protein (DUF1697 family)